MTKLTFEVNPETGLFTHYFSFEGLPTVAVERGDTAWHFRCEGKDVVTYLGATFEEVESVARAFATEIRNTRISGPRPMPTRLTVNDYELMGRLD